MAITYPLDLPTVSGFVDFSWMVTSNVPIQEAEFTRGIKKYKWDGFLRKASMRVGSMTYQQAKKWEAFVLRLNIREGNFKLQDPLGAAVEGAYDGSGSPAVNGASQHGPNLVTDGWPAGVTGLLKAGDYIAIRGRLYQLTADANSSGGGAATLEIWPHATFQILNNDVITVGVNAFGIFCLDDDVEFPRNVEKLSEGFQLTVREDFL